MLWKAGLSVLSSSSSYSCCVFPFLLVDKLFEGRYCYVHNFLSFLIPACCTLWNLPNSRLLNSRDHVFLYFIFLGETLWDSEWYTRLEVQRPWFKSQPQFLLVWPWADHPMFLSFSFLIYKMGIKILAWHTSLGGKCFESSKAPYKCECLYLFQFLAQCMFDEWIHE